jgi:hypothetical protein
MIDDSYFPSQIIYCKWLGLGVCALRCIFHHGNWCANLPILTAIGKNIPSGCYEKKFMAMEAKGRKVDIF